MKRFEKRLQQLVRNEPEPQGPATRENCPTPEDLAFSFEPDCPLEIKTAIISHISYCPACRREFELLRGTRQFISRLEKRVAQPKPGLLKKRVSFLGLAWPWWKMASSFVLLIAILSMIYLGLNYLNSLKEERETMVADRIVLHEEVSWPRPAAIKLGWKSAGDGLFYRVEIYDQNMYLLWQSPPVYETRLELPDSVLESLKDYQYFFWQLLIYSGEDQILESPVRKVRLLSQ
ncbi:MAG: hypothetical protein N3G18_02960 [Candidatus Saccharicenans sp.]|nr:hypothetical protein [Candidatus Saccharicenans sp.]